MIFFKLYLFNSQFAGSQSFIFNLMLFIQICFYLFMIF
jgi:hypothetical protein